MLASFKNKYLNKKIDKPKNLIIYEALVLDLAYHVSQIYEIRK